MTQQMHMFLGPRRRLLSEVSVRQSLGPVRSLGPVVGSLFLSWMWWATSAVLSFMKSAFSVVGSSGWSWSLSSASLVWPGFDLLTSEGGRTSWGCWRLPGASWGCRGYGTSCSRQPCGPSSSRGGLKAFFGNSLPLSALSWWLSSLTSSQGRT